MHPTDRCIKKGGCGLEGIYSKENRQKNDQNSEKVEHLQKLSEPPLKYVLQFRGLFF